MSWHGRDKVLQASITYNRKQNYIWYFGTPEDAVNARNKYIDDNNLPHKKE